jgi:hypothetical protein
MDKYWEQIKLRKRLSKQNKKKFKKKNCVRDAYGSGCVENFESHPSLVR